MNTGTEGIRPWSIVTRISEYFGEFAQNPWTAIVDDERLCLFMTETRTEEVLS